MKNIIFIVGIISFCIFVAYATKQTLPNETGLNNVATSTLQNTEVNDSNTITKRYSPIIEQGETSEPVIKTDTQPKEISPKIEQNTVVKPTVVTPIIPSTKIDNERENEKEDD